MKIERACGIAVDHLNEPNYGLTETTARHPVQVATLLVLTVPWDGRNGDQGGKCLAPEGAVRGCSPSRDSADDLISAHQSAAQMVR